MIYFRGRTKFIYQYKFTRVAKRDEADLETKIDGCNDDIYGSSI